jgi:7,8-dihydropterin-6-yl-methyl-4-(beta-D-ribofuranosyl)aminobenzene 5'-phosphate synthase
MPPIATVDSIDVLVIVDNVTDSLSTNPVGVVSEFAGLLTRGRIRMMAGSNICCAHHGLSLLISAKTGDKTETLLFDAGAESATFLRNAGILGIDFGSISDVVLSHGHWDHAGGLTSAIEQIAKVRGSGNVNCHMHPGMFAQRGMTLPSGIIFPMERVPNPAELTRAGAVVVNSRESQMLGNGAFYVSGEIPRNTPYEAGLPGQVRRSDDASSWEPDPLLVDERFVSVQVKDKGLFVFSACSHAGIINVLSHACTVFPSVPVHGIMGGLHLSGSTERIIPDTVADLQRFDLKLLAPGHCTGWRALCAMEAAFKDRVVPLAVGKRFTL